MILKKCRIVVVYEINRVKSASLSTSTSTSPFPMTNKQLTLTVKDLLHKIMVGKESIEVELTIGTRINGLLEEIVVGTLDG